MYIGNVIFLILVVISFAGLYKIFKKTGRTPWKAFVPFLNFYEWIKLLERPWWWVFLMIVPGVNILMYSVLAVITAQYYGKRKTLDLTFAAFFSFLYIVYIGNDKTAKWTGIDDIKDRKGGFIKTWLDPLIFAVIAATVIRTFFLEAFTIPTSSLEKSLMVGDFLFVNKFAYGAKIPQTPLAFPFAHHTLPFTKETKSYLEWIKLPYWRLPGYTNIKNGDIVVFNYPDGDTVALGFQDRSYYQLCRSNGVSSLYNQPKTQIYTGGAPEYQQVGNVVARPVDKREHYVKRCVGIAGDKIEIKAGDLFINDIKTTMPENAQHRYFVKSIDFDFLDEKWLDMMDIYVDEVGRTQDIPGSPGITDSSAGLLSSTRSVDTAVYVLNLTEAKVAQIKSMPQCLGIQKFDGGKGNYDASIFPHDPRYPWNNDNFGPFVLPKAGSTVKIDTLTLSLYRKILDTYDAGYHMVEVKGSQVYYDGSPINEYTFKQDYYWMMGDNRHNSADSRSWGVVPFDHVVGKPVFVWFSMKDPTKNPESGKSWVGSLTKNSKDGKFRWERFFCFVGDKGLSKSYFIHFLVIAGAWWGVSRYLRKRKEKKEATK
jgi:signal peptidase I